MQGPSHKVDILPKPVKRKVRNRPHNYNGPTLQSFLKKGTAIQTSDWRSRTLSQIQLPGNSCGHNGKTTITVCQQSPRMLMAQYKIYPARYNPDTSLDKD